MVTLTINGSLCTVDADDQKSLLWVLRDELGLTGTKYGCGVGVCGICVVLIDGEPNHACQVPLSEAANREVTTIEGIDAGHRLVRAWIAEQVPQCGYCQPGQLLCALALLNRNPPPGDSVIEATMSSVFCRCGTYPRIRRAITRAIKNEPIEIADMTPIHPGADIDYTPLNDFIAVGTDGTVRLIVNHSEMGQGSLTGLAMLVAEEIEVALSAIRTVFAPADVKYKNSLWGQQFTGGSSSIRGEWEPFRRVAASARHMLIAAAAKRLKVKDTDCLTENGAIKIPSSGARLSYAELASDAAKHSPPKQVTLKQAGSWRLIGNATPRLEIPEMVLGRTSYGIDVRRPDMLVANVVRCPTFGGRVKRIDAQAARASPGVREVVDLGDRVAVVAEDFHSALRGREALTVEWNLGANASVDNKTISRQLLEALDRDGRVETERGNIEAAFATAENIIEATYTTPYLAHATLEPMNCIAHVQKNRCDIWVGTQSQVDTQAIGAKLSGLSKRKVFVHTQFLGGGFGRRLETDFVADAVELSKKLHAPVQVIWTRADDLQHDKYRPAGAARLRAMLDASGRPAAWFQRIAGSELALEGSGVPYAVPNFREQYVEVPSPLPCGPWRSVGASNNVFAIECFIDELAHAAGHDPLVYRLALLNHEPRLRNVLSAAAERAAWGKPKSSDRHQGVAAFHGFGSWVAQIAEVSLNEDGIKVERVVCATDCGTVVNPDAVAAQMEGGVLFGLSAALKEAIRIENGAVTQSSLADYSILTFAEAPEVEVVILPSAEPPGGAGEPTVPVIGPAVANAVFAATGQRLRAMPLKLAR